MKHLNLIYHQQPQPKIYSDYQITPIMKSMHTPTFTVFRKVATGYEARERVKPTCHTSWISTVKLIRIGINKDLITAFFVLILLLIQPLLLLCAQSTSPDIGYIYPAGGQRGTTLYAVVGGQRLRGMSYGFISGEGVTVQYIDYYKPIRRIKPEQIALLKKKLIPRIKQCWNKLRATGAVKGDLPWLKRGGLLKTRKKKKQTIIKGVAYPSHPLLEDLHKASLRKIEHALNYFFQNRFMRQINTQIAELVLLKITIGKNAKPGSRNLRLAGRNGLSDTVTFQIGNLPEVNELEQNDPGNKSILPQRAPFQLPVLINGQILPGDVDQFRVSLKHNKHITVSLAGRKLIPFLPDAVPGWFQPCISIHDKKGQELAYADDRHFHPDPVLNFLVPEDGVYSIRVRDAIYRGREDFIYRIKVQYENRKQHQNKIFQLPELKTNIPVLLERQTRKLIKLPTMIRGKIAKKDESDTYRFKGKRNQLLIAEVIARRVGSPLDSVIELYNAKNRVIAWNDDSVDKKGQLHRGIGRQTHFADSYLSTQLPQNGIYTLKITDVRGAGSTEHGYYLRLSPPRPDFSLYLTPSGVNMTSEMDSAVTVHLLPMDGFKGEVSLEFAKQPPFLKGKNSFATIGGKIPPGADSLNFTIRAPKLNRATLCDLSIIGTSTISGRRVSRIVKGADNKMQAFLWRHLVPANELLALVNINRFGMSPRLLNETPVLLPAGGRVIINYAVKKLYAKRTKVADMRLLDPPDGLQLTSYTLSPGRLKLILDYNGEEALSDNVIIEVFINRGKKKNKMVSAGFLPCVPLRIGCAASGEK